MHIHNPDDTIAQKMREENIIFYKKAKKMFINIVRCCGVGTFSKNKIDGRSLAVTPNKIIFRMDAKGEKKELYKLIKLAIPK